LPDLPYNVPTRERRVAVAEQVIVVARNVLMEQQRQIVEDKKREYFSEDEEEDDDDDDNPFANAKKEAPPDPLSPQFQDFIRALPDCPMNIGFHVNVTVCFICRVCDAILRTPISIYAGGSFTLFLF
jgi:hypothetical protein